MFIDDDLAARAAELRELGYDVHATRVERCGQFGPDQKPWACGFRYCPRCAVRNAARRAKTAYAGIRRMEPARHLVLKWFCSVRDLPKVRARIAPTLRRFRQLATGRFLVPGVAAIEVSWVGSKRRPCLVHAHLCFSGAPPAEALLRRAWRRLVDEQEVGHGGLSLDTTLPDAAVKSASGFSKYIAKAPSAAVDVGRLPLFRFEKLMQAEKGKRALLLWGFGTEEARPDAITWPENGEAR